VDADDAHRPATAAPTPGVAVGTSLSGAVQSTVPSGAAPTATPRSTSDATALSAYAAETAGCERCALSRTRTQVVFGAGSPTAELMFVGEAPGFHEDRQGVPFVGAAGQLLSKLLAGIGLAREDVYIANVLKCRPPGNRDPQPDEIEACEAHLFRQIELIQPSLVATLGNFATKLLSGRPAGITKVHGQPQDVVLGGRPVRLFPIFHPAAALYTPRMLEVLEADFARIPALLGATLEAQAEPEPAAPEPAAEPAVQLGLF
jgi:DNA polymerase